MERQQTSVSKTMTITGTIIDGRTEEVISGANIYLKSLRTKSTYSNEQGRFTLQVETTREKDTLVITSAGYLPIKSEIKVKDYNNLSFKLNKRKKDKISKDAELVKAALNGDQKAYGRLMERYRDSIFFMIQKMVNDRNDAEDLTMEAFGKAFSKLANYSSEFAFSTWLYRIAINNAIDHIRKKRLDVYLTIDENVEDGEGSMAPREIPGESRDPEEEMIKKQRILMMRGVIANMPAKYRKLIEMRYLKELSYDEISTITKSPLGTIKAQLYRAKELLSNMMDGTQGNI